MQKLPTSCTLQKLIVLWLHLPSCHISAVLSSFNLNFLIKLSLDGLNLEQGINTVAMKVSVNPWNFLVRHLLLIKRTKPQMDNWKNCFSYPQHYLKESVSIKSQRSHCQDSPPPPNTPAPVILPNKIFETLSESFRQYLHIRPTY